MTVNTLRQLRIIGGRLTGNTLAILWWNCTQQIVLLFQIFLTQRLIAATFPD